MAVDSAVGTLGVGTDVVGYALRIVVDGTAVGCNCCGLYIGINGGVAVGYMYGPNLW